MPNICPRYASDIFLICQRYAQDSHKVCQKYAQIISKDKHLAKYRAYPDFFNLLSDVRNWKSDIRHYIYSTCQPGGEVLFDVMTICSMQWYAWPIHIEGKAHENEILKRILSGFFDLWWGTLSNLLGLLRLKTVFLKAR